MLKVKGNNLFALQLILCFLFISTVSSQGVTFTTDPFWQTGQYLLYDDPYLNITTPLLYNITYDAAFDTANVGMPSKAGVAIAGIQCYLGFQMAWNLTVASFDVNWIQIQFTSIDSTYIRQLVINYIVFSASNTILDIEYGCFQTLTLNTGYGDRYQLFDNQTNYFTQVASPNPPVLRVINGITAVKMINNVGVSNIINTKSWINPGENKIRHNISIYQNNTLEQICLTTVILTIFDPVIQPVHLVVYQTGYFYSNINSSLPDVNQAYNAQNRMYWSIAGFNFSLGATRYYMFDTTNITAMNFSLATNQFAIWVHLQYLLLVRRDCVTPTDFYIIQNYTCQSTCSALQSNQVFNGNSYQTCLSCDPTCDGCALIQTNCTACFTTTQFRILNANKCECNSTAGYFDNGNVICDKCIDFLAGCQICTNSIQCIQCQTGFILDNTTFTCGCDPGFYLATGICLTFPGCLEAYQIITGKYCNLCDSTKYFQIDISTNYTCTCMLSTFYNNVTQSCSDNCGDGLTPPISGACDDGNTVGGDGCSSTCYIQAGYTCTYNHTTGGKSTCGLSQDISISYLFSQRVLTSNQGKLYFQLSPNQPFLSTTAFANSLTINAPYSSKVVQFDPVTSQIIVTLTYIQDMEGQSYSALFSFSGMSISSPDITVNFATKGINARLLIDQNPSQNLIFYYVGLALGCSALVVAIICSVLGQKMIGIQLILPVQAIFFTISSITSPIPPAISSLSTLKYSNGYNVIETFTLSNNYMNSPNVLRLGYDNQYILNYNLMFVFVLFILISMIGIYIRITFLLNQQEQLQNLMQDKKEKKRRNQKQDNSEDQELNTAEDGQDKSLVQLQQQLEQLKQNIQGWTKFFQTVMDRLLVIAFITTTLQILFSLELQISNVFASTLVMDYSLNALFLFLTVTTLLIGLFYIAFDYKSQKKITYNCNKGKFAMFYIGFFIFYIFILGATYKINGIIYFMTFLSILPIILVVYQVPYMQGFFNYHTMICTFNQVSFFVANLSYLYLNISSVSEQISQIIGFVIIGLIGTSIALTIFRLVKQVDCKKLNLFDFWDKKQGNTNDKRKNNNITLLELDIDHDWGIYAQDSVRSALFAQKKAGIDWDQKNQKQYDSIQKDKMKKDQLQNQEDSQGDQDLDELQKVKKKLRKELKAKKAQGKIR